MEAGSGFATFVAPSAATVMAARGRDHARASRGCDAGGEGESCAKELFARLDLAGRPRATFAGSAGTRERGRGRPESASRAGEEGACDHARRPTASAGRLPRGEVAENDVSRRSRTMTCAFVAPENKTPWQWEFSPVKSLSRATARNSKSAAGKLKVGKSPSVQKPPQFVPRGAPPERTRRVYRGDGGVARVGVSNSQASVRRGNRATCRLEACPRRCVLGSAPSERCPDSRCSRNARRAAREIPRGARLADLLRLPSSPPLPPRRPFATSEPRRTSA